MGDELGDSLRADIYDDGCARPPPSGEVTGVWGLRNTNANGEGGPEVGVSGRFSRTECDEAREEGRDAGRRVGVRNRNGTPATSSRCLCIKSKTCCST